MFFTKFPHPANFAFFDGYDAVTHAFSSEQHEISLALRSFEGELSHLSLSDPKRWGARRTLIDLLPPAETATGMVSVGPDGRIKVAGLDGETLMRGRFGVLGQTSMFEFEIEGEPQFFGMGEKLFGTQELSGYRTKFWNTDVWSDFHFGQWGASPSDPPYFSTPYVAVRIGSTFLGLLLDNPYPAFMETPGIDESRVFVEWQRTSDRLLLGNEGGEPNLWVILGPSLPELTRKLQRLVGVTPLPPIWSLGYHQSKWGYGGHRDLMALDAKFTEHGIPCDGLWLDLDYMDGYRIFTVDEQMFPNGPEVTADALEASGRRIVPIIDPGVKKEVGYPVYDDGLAKDVFCLTSEKRPYVGIVWPGETVFPDFTLGKVRKWWAGYAKEFRASGFGGCWVDMNDPSTGPVDPAEMRFNNGKDPHHAHRNQYALGMQMATYEGFLSARPNERPFILSRSGYTGSSRFSAIWTGDNVSNYWYLRTSIPTAIGMSLSGLPFTGMDIGGFGGDCDESLMRDWIKLAFLFPFTRCHNGKGNADQEPWAYPKKSMEVIRRYIRLRYKLLPYLYGLFIDQERFGDPILRPVLYHFDEEGVERLDDQFMIGDCILQAPFVDERRVRTVHLPGDQPWFDAQSGDWVGPGPIEVERTFGGTPLFIRAGSALPMLPGTPTTNEKDLRRPNFHIFAPPEWSGKIEATYHADDGLTFDYRRGVRSTVRLEVVIAKGRVVINMSEMADDYGPIDAGFVLHGASHSLKINGRMAGLAPDRVVMTGKPLMVKVAD